MVVHKLILKIKNPTNVKNLLVTALTFKPFIFPILISYHKKCNKNKKAKVCHKNRLKREVKFRFIVRLHSFLELQTMISDKNKRLKETERERENKI